MVFNCGYHGAYRALERSFLLVDTKSMRSLASNLTFRLERLVDFY